MKRLVKEDGKLLIKEDKEMDKLSDNLELLSENIIIVISKIKKELQKNNKTSKLKDIDKIVKEFATNMDDLFNIINE